MYLVDHGGPDQVGVEGRNAPKALTLRSWAERLERSDDRLLGARATMEIARAWNGVRTARLLEARARLHERDLEALFAENGPVARAPSIMRDGWALDTSGSLPHLEELISDAARIIDERGGVMRGGGERSFFQQIMTDEHVARYPSILAFGTSSALLRTVIDYMKLIPTLSVSKPLGIRLAESDERLGEPLHGRYRQSQLYHRDYHAQPMVYAIVALRDITAQSGPFTILPAAASDRASEALRYGERGSPYRVPDARMYEVARREDIFEFACPRGSVLFVDSSRCFHYGSRDAKIPRYQMMYAYVPVRRSDFGDLLRPESPTPVLDDSARTRRARYPVRAGDSRLKRLLLDRLETGGA